MGTAAAATANAMTTSSTSPVAPAAATAAASASAVAATEVPIPLVSSESKESEDFELTPIKDRMRAFVESSSRQQPVSKPVISVPKMVSPQNRYYRKYNVIIVYCDCDFMKPIKTNEASISNSFCSSQVEILQPGAV